MSEELFLCLRVSISAHKQIGVIASDVEHSCGEIAVIAHVQDGIGWHKMERKGEGRRRGKQRKPEGEDRWKVKMREIQGKGGEMHAREGKCEVGGSH